MLSWDTGMAWQKDMQVTAEYNGAYFDKYVGYEDTEIANAINNGRIALVDKYVGRDGVLDIGIGSGEFIKKRSNTWGYDINPKAIDWLKSVKRWADTFAAFDAFTFWDVLEHIPNHDPYFRKIHSGAHLFTSLPIFKDLSRIRESRHYRPGEHLFYFTEWGFIAWMASHRFMLLEIADFETRAGRDNILSFAYVRD